MKNLNHKIFFTKKFKYSRPALFLDRDGVIIEDLHYIKDPEKVKLCEGIFNLIKSANIYNIPVIVITNQSGISRNIFTWKDYEKINNKMIELLGKKAKISAIYGNGYSSLKKNNWRKPNPDMLLDASKNLNLSLKNSIIIGDRLTDLLAGKNAGVKLFFHVKTGHGVIERDKVKEKFKEYLNTEEMKEFPTNTQKIYLLENLKEFPYFLFKKYYSNNF